MALAEFHLFTELPLEIRLKIWHCCITPRYIPIISSPEADSSNCHALCAPPPLLSICHESREEALKTYNLSFVNQLTHPIFFSPPYDILMLNETSMRLFYESSSYPELRTKCQEELRLVRTVLSTGLFRAFSKPMPLEDIRSAHRGVLDDIFWAFKDATKLVVMTPPAEKLTTSMKLVTRDNIHGYWRDLARYAQYANADYERHPVSTECMCCVCKPPRVSFMTTRELGDAMSWTVDELQQYQRRAPDSSLATLRIG